MKVLLTFKLSPESRMEMIDKFGGLYRELREDMEGFQQGGIVTPVLLQALHDATIRWVIQSGRWD